MLAHVSVFFPRFQTTQSIHFYVVKSYSFSLLALSYFYLFFLPLFYISLFRTGRVYVQSQRYHLLLYDLLSRPLSTGDVLFTNFWFHLEFQCIKVHFTFWMAVQPLFFFWECTASALFINDLHYAVLNINLLWSPIQTSGSTYIEITCACLGLGSMFHFSVYISLSI